MYIFVLIKDVANFALESAKFLIFKPGSLNAISVYLPLDYYFYDLFQFFFSLVAKTVNVLIHECACIWLGITGVQFSLDGVPGIFQIALQFQTIWQIWMTKFITVVIISRAHVFVFVYARCFFLLRRRYPFYRIVCFYIPYISFLGEQP